MTTPGRQRYGLRSVILFVFIFADVFQWISALPTCNATNPCVDLNFVFTSELRGKLLPSARSGAACDPLDSDGCYGGNARRKTWIEHRRAELASENQGLHVFDLGGSVFGGVLSHHPDYNLGTPETILQNMVPYEFCLMSRSDFLISDLTDTRAQDLANSYAARTCPLLLSNVAFGKQFDQLNSKMQRWHVKTLPTGHKVGFVGMFPHDSQPGESFPPDYVSVDPKGMQEDVLVGTYGEELDVNGTKLESEIYALNGNFQSFEGYKKDLYYVASMVPQEVLNAAAEMKEAHPDILTMVLLCGRTERSDQIRWMLQHGPFNIIFIPFRMASVQVSKPGLQEHQSYKGESRILVVAEDTVRGMAQIKVQVDTKGSVLRHKYDKQIKIRDSDIHPGGKWPSDPAIYDLTVDMYEVTRKLNSKQYGTLSTYIGGVDARKDPSDAADQCYFTMCNIAIVASASRLWAARSQNYEADISLGNIGGLRSSMDTGPVDMSMCKRLLGFQNLLSIYEVVGNDLLAALKLTLDQWSDVAIAGSGFRYKVADPCWEQRTKNADPSVRYQDMDIKTENEACNEAGKAYKLIDVEIFDYKTQEWKQLQKGTVYRVVSDAYNSGRWQNFKDLGVPLGEESNILCNYIEKHSPLQATPWEELEKQHKRYDSPSQCFQNDNPLCFVKTEVSIIDQTSLCPSGQFLDSVAKRCSPCRPGTIASLDQRACEPCMAGMYSEKAGEKFCHACAPGKFNQDLGQSSCHDCPLSYWSAAAKSECYPCPAGTFSQYKEAGNKTIDASTTCMKCPSGTWSNESAALQCQECPPMHVTRFLGAESLADCTCGEGWYMDREGSGKCIPCPAGMSCALGSATFENALAKPLVKPKGWSSLSEPFSVFECESETRCPGGGPDTCGPLLTGRACVRCVDEHYWDGNECKACTPIETTGFWFPVVPLLILPAIIVAMYVLYYDKLELWGSWQNGFAASSFIVLNHYQVLHLVRTTNIQFPSDLGNTLGIWAFTDDVLSVFKIVCSGYQDFEKAMIIRAVGPCVLAVVFVMVFYGSRVVEKITKKEEHSMKWDRTINVYLALILAFYNGIAASSLLVFKCVENPNGTSSLARDRSIVCFESQWDRMVVVGILAVLFYCIGFGVLFLWVIWNASRDFHKQEFQTRWQFLFIKFRPKVPCHAWSLVVIGKGILLNLGFTFLGAGLAQAYWILTTCVVYLCLLTCFNPWRHRLANLIDAWSHISVIFICSMLTWFAHAGEENVEAKSRELEIWSMVISFSCLPVAVSVMVCMYKNAQDHAKNSDADAAGMRNAFERFVLREKTEAVEFIQGLGEWDKWHMAQVQEMIMVELMGAKEESNVKRISARPSLTSKIEPEK